MDHKRYVAAIEIGSSKITGVAGTYDDNGQLTIEASEQEEIRESVRYGIIQNLEETATRVSRIIDKLQRSKAVAPKKIHGVFAGLSGRSMRSVTVNASIQFGEETEITERHTEQLREDALRSVADTNLEVVDALPRSYKVGVSETKSPVGALGREISATYDIIVCRPELKRNLTKVLSDKCGLKIEGFVVTSLATGHLMLSSEEKRLGCMLVDMGAETTSVSVYHKGALRYFATLPLGGRNITRDLTALSPLLEERAEEIKRTSGNAMAREVPQMNIDGLKYSDVSKYIVARSEEIVANIVEQISYAGLKEKDLPAGIICIGGGMELKGMEELLGRQSGLPVRQGRLPEYIHFRDAARRDYSMTGIDCVLYEGASLSDAECLEMPSAEEVPVTGELPVTPEIPEDKVEDTPRGNSSRLSNWFKTIHTKIGGIFTPPDDSESDLYE